MDAVCRTDRVMLVDTYQFDDSAADVFEREPYAVKFSLTAHARQSILLCQFLHMLLL